MRKTAKAACALLLAGTTLLAIAGDVTVTKPNFVFIMADDMGYGDPSCYGGSIQTPNLDRMAREGLRFTDFHSSGTVCSPSRAGLLTGRYQQRSGIDGVISADPATQAYKLGLDPEIPTFSRILSENGYKTALFGKWHLGYHRRFNPLHYDFDRFVGFISGNIDYHSHYNRMGTYDWWHGRKQVQEEGYSTHLITQHAVDYIREHANEPFCVYVAHEAVHTPMQGPEDAIQRGPDKDKNTGQKRPTDVIFCRYASGDGCRRRRGSGGNLRGWHRAQDSGDFHLR